MATSIGELNVKLSASADAFNAVMKSSEKTLSTFAAKAASPLTFGLGAMTGIGGVLGSVSAFTKPLSEFFEKLPGFDDWAHLLDPAKATAAFHEMQKDLVDLGRSADRLGLSPQFLKTLREMAGPDAEVAEKAIGKLFATVGQGAEGTVAKLEKWGIAWEDIRTGDPADILGALADAYKGLDDPLQKAAMRFELAGKGAMGLHKILAGGKEGLDAYAQKIKGLGLATDEAVAGAQAIAQIEKGERQEYAGFTAQAFEKYGLKRIAGRAEMESADSIFSEKFGRGLDAWLMSYVPDFLVPDKIARELPPEFVARRQPFLDALKKPKPTAEEIGIRQAAEAEKATDAVFVFADAARTAGERAGMTADQIKLLELRMAGASAESIQAAEAAVQFRQGMTAGVEIDKLNDSLVDQEQMLQIATEGWKGFESQILAVRKAAAAGADMGGIADAMRKLEGLRAGQQEKAAEGWEEKIKAALGRGGKQPFAPTAVMGGQEAANAFNREFADTGVGDIAANVQQLVDMFKKPALSPEMEQNIRQAARELEKINRNLDPLGPV